ncbi:MAG TPA: alpha-2-macroglobulin family protein [Saprospiraceae bacterium]|nr:alpha-2-macroglobulin family protein [Saprospiraceae bacterium]
MKKLYFLLTFTIILISSCKKQEDDATLIDVSTDLDSVSEYLVAATQGVISADDDLNFILKNSLLNEPSPDQVKELIAIKPNVTGVTTVTNHTIINFTPTSGFESDMNYELTLHLHDLFPSQYQKNVRIHFKTFKQEFTVEENGFIINDDNSINILALIKTADKVKPKMLLSCFSSDAKEMNINALNNNTYEISLLYNGNLNENSFLKYDGSRIKASSSGQLSFKDKISKEFMIMSSIYHSDDKEYKVFFSKKINPDQDLSGIITVNGHDAQTSIKQNELTIFTSTFTTDKNLKIVINEALKSSEKKNLIQSYTFDVSNQMDMPVAEFAKEGNYFPSNGEFYIPIKTKALKKLRVFIVEIKQENVKHYLTWQSLQNTEYYNLRMFGKPIYDQEFDINYKLADPEGWTITGLDLHDQIQRNPGSIYSVSLSISPSNTLLSCVSSNQNFQQRQIPDKKFFKGGNNYYDDYYYDYDWREQDDPCSLSYYFHLQAEKRNFICSDYSIIAKRAGESYHIAVSDLISLVPTSGAHCTLFDMQGEMIDNGTTSSQGFVTLNSNEYQASVLKVDEGGKVTFMSLDDNESNPLTEFDVSGNRSALDNKYMLYTERDVWRPGDSIYLDLMINRKATNIPYNLPAVVEFYNVENVLIDRQMQNLDISDKLIYNFILKTNQSSKSGTYRVKMSIGDDVLYKYLRIENIKPNTAEVLFSFNNENSNKWILDGNPSGTLKAQYLTGFALKNAKIKTEALAKPMSTPFEKFKDYNFNDYRNQIENKFLMFETTTNDNGEAIYKSARSLESVNVPMNLYLETETILPGGGSNKEGKKVIVSPLESYIGIKRNAGSGWRDNYVFNDDVKIDLISLDAEGKVKNSDSNIKYTIQENVKYWWVDKYRLRSSGNYNHSNYWKNIRSEEIKVNGQKELTINHKDWDKGAYRIIAEDLNSGHISHIYFTIYNGTDRIPGAEPYILEFETDKDSYSTGEEIKLSIPGIKDAKALVSIETSTKVIDQFWVELTDKQETIRMNASKEWSPNVYVHISVIQKYLNTDNDLPLRLYGVKPLKIDGTTAGLKPIVNIPEKLESNKTYEIEVSESQGRNMQYTLTLVDEGLVNLTGYRIPDPLNHFDGKFPLLVKTWDIYSRLMRFFNGDYAGIVSIGGDDTYHADALPEVNRFKSVVIHLGTYKLGINKKNKHTIQIPNYIGKLRLTVTACSTDNFGSTEKSVLVKNPLMVQSQLPRSLNISDKFPIPITVFKDDENIKNVEVKVTADPKVIKLADNTRKLDMSTEDQDILFMPAEIKDKAGVTKILIDAAGGSKNAKEDTEIAVNYPNSYTSAVKTYTVDAGKSLDLTIDPMGYPDAFHSDLQLSGVKVPEFTKYADELIRYPYGCLEQSSSAAFSQLYLDKIVKLDPKQNQERLANLQAILLKLLRFQKSNGRFSYWENDYYSGWADIYAGNLLVEMKTAKLLPNNSDMLKKWLNYQYKSANDWSYNSPSDSYNYESESLVQAYRLYVLAKADKSAKSAMNRFLGSNQSSSPVTWWLLAGAYQLAGYESKALELIDKAENLQKNPNKYYYLNFGSNERDFAIVVEVLALFPRLKEKMQQYYFRMVDNLNQRSWVNTQTKGYAFIAINRFFNGEINLSESIQYNLQFDNKADGYEHSATSVNVKEIKSELWGKPIKITNTSTQKLFVSVINRYISKDMNTPASSNNLSLSVNYFNTTSSDRKMSDIRLGDDILIVVNVNNLTALSQENLALNLKMPGGFELINPRLYATENSNQSSRFTYQDFKDDRVYTFFDMAAGGTHSYSFRAKATFEGDFFQPAIKCEHMYDGDIYANTKSGRVSVKK